MDRAGWCFRARREVRCGAHSAPFGQGVTDLVQGYSGVPGDPTQSDGYDLPQLLESSLCFSDNDPVRSAFEFALRAVDGILVICEGEQRSAGNGRIA